MNATERDDTDSLLLRDYDQAWNHLRHVESTRIQYTGFFFTIVLGSIALAIPLFTQRTVVISSLVVASCFAGALATFSSSIYLTMKRMGVQLSHYRRSIEQIRDHFYRRSNLDENLKKHFAAEARARYAGGVQRTNELIVLSFSFAALVAELVIVAAILIRNGRWWQAAIAVAVFLASSVPVAIATKWWRK